MGVPKDWDEKGDRRGGPNRGTSGNAVPPLLPHSVQAWPACRPYQTPDRLPVTDQPLRLALPCPECGQADTVYCEINAQGHPISPSWCVACVNRDLAADFVIGQVASLLHEDEVDDQSIKMVVDALLEAARHNDELWEALGQATRREGQA